MAAEDPGETIATFHTDTVARTNTEESVTLAPPVADWLARRTALATTEVSVSIAVLPGRWLICVEAGACGSTIDWPTCRQHRVGDVALALRRWARGAGMSARIEAQRSGEARVVLGPRSAARA